MVLFTGSGFGGSVLLSVGCALTYDCGFSDVFPSVDFFFIEDIPDGSSRNERMNSSGSISDSYTLAIVHCLRVDGWIRA